MLQQSTKRSLQQGMPLQGCEAGKRPQVFPRGHGEASLPARPESLDGLESKTVICTIREIGNGVYITANCGDENIKLLVDTGAMITVISISVFGRVNSSKQASSELHPTEIKLLQANGAPIRVCGEATISLSIGTNTYECETVVA